LDKPDPEMVADSKAIAAPERPTLTKASFISVTRRALSNSGTSAAGAVTAAAKLSIEIVEWRWIKTLRVHQGCGRGPGFYEFLCHEQPQGLFFAERRRLAWAR
jgi:hypothetical protein